MLYELVQTRRGKATVVMTDEFTKVNGRKKALLKSHKNGINGDRVDYTVRPTTNNVKAKQKPHDRRW